jgi:hypothetical protein
MLNSRFEPNFFFFLKGGFEPKDSSLKRWEVMISLSYLQSKNDLFQVSARSFFISPLVR